MRRGGTEGEGLSVPAGGGDGRAVTPRGRFAPGRKMEEAAAGRAGQEISLAALQRHDPYITSIADVTGQVALYSFSPKANEWVSDGQRGRGSSLAAGRALVIVSVLWGWRAATALTF